MTDTIAQKLTAEFSELPRDGSGRIDKGILGEFRKKLSKESQDNWIWIYPLKASHDPSVIYRFSDRSILRLVNALQIEQGAKVDLPRGCQPDGTPIF